MESHDEKQSGLDAAYHEDLELTEGELREGLAAEGLDPDAAVAELRALGRSLRAKYGGGGEAPPRMEAALLAPLPIYGESVAAGLPEWTGVSGRPEEAALFAVMGGADADDFMWARVSGWSMRDVGICPGDVVLVDRKARPKSGDVVLAHLAGKGQLIKRLTISSWNKAVLESANPDFPDIEVDDPADIRIHGVVVGRAGTLIR